MIDIATEHLLAIRDVPLHLPLRRSGRRVHISAVYRWLQRGTRGVQLESIRIGGTTYTSTEALARWSRQLSQPLQEHSAYQPETTTARQRQIEEATRKVRAILRIPEENDSRQ